VTYFESLRETSNLSQNNRKLDSVLSEYKFRVFMDTGYVRNTLKLHVIVLHLYISIQK
jgi:hypothetical protein